jgi:hypothetical protein
MLYNTSYNKSLHGSPAAQGVSCPQHMYTYVCLAGDQSCQVHDPHRDSG